MSLLAVALFIFALFGAAYLTYGRFLSHVFELNPQTPTPAQAQNDGVDFIPTAPPVLLGQHFAAIAAVGPIVGPILAGMVHGWMPGLFWIALGTIFIGGVHDFAALIASVRHGARSVAELVKIYVTPRAYLIFLAFIWVSLIYVIIVFTDLTASAFVAPPYGGGVATSSLLYLGLAVGMGFVMARTQLPLWLITLVFVPLLFGFIVVGQQIPIALPPLPFPGGSPQNTWFIAILVYCLIASIIPLGTLLQPRGYLGATFLYGSFAVGLIGMLMGGVHAEFPSRIPQLLFGLPAAGVFPIFPLLFTTIACGACSGFHGIVSSGTTSKQLRRETDAKLIGYGGMMLEGIVALIALATLMMLGPGDPLLAKSPDEIYAYGLGHFAAMVGIPLTIGITFGKLAFATFIYDTLDVATRLGRYIFQEFTGWRGRAGAIAATAATLLIPAGSLFWTATDAAGKSIPLWKSVWPLFGASNQLLAALILTAVTLWLYRTGKKWWVTGIPAVFMLVMTLWSLGLLIVMWAAGIGSVTPPIGIGAVIILMLALVILADSLLSLRKRPL